MERRPPLPVPNFFNPARTFAAEALPFPALGAVPLPPPFDFVDPLGMMFLVYSIP